jgi:hypothetical protein
MFEHSHLTNRDGVRPGRGGLTVPGQERCERGNQLLGSLIGDPAAGAGDDDGLHFGRGGLHPVPGLFAPAFRSAVLEILEDEEISGLCWYRTSSRREPKTTCSLAQ